MSITPSFCKTFSISLNKVSVVTFDPLTLAQTISDFWLNSLGLTFILNLQFFKLNALFFEISPVIL